MCRRSPYGTSAGRFRASIRIIQLYVKGYQWNTLYQLVAVQPSEEAVDFHDEHTAASGRHHYPKLEWMAGHDRVSRELPQA